MFRSTIRRPARLFAAAALAASLSLPALAQDAVTVRVVHGIPGGDIAPLIPTVDPALPVDVLVNDAICLLSGFTFGQVEGPFTIPGGTYNVKVSLADTLAPCSGDAVIEADVPLTGGTNVSIVAHLSTAGAPTASVFRNDVSKPAEGRSRIIAHHLANAPAVDLSVSGGFPPSARISVPNVTNGAQAAAEIMASTSTIGITPAGGRFSIFNRTVRLVAGLSYTVYAVGSLDNGTFTLIAEPIGGLSGTTIVF